MRPRVVLARLSLGVCLVLVASFALPPGGGHLLLPPASAVRRKQLRAAREAPAFRIRRLFGKGMLTELSELEDCSRVQARTLLTSRIILGPLANLPALDALHEREEPKT